MRRSLYASPFPSIDNICFRAQRLASGIAKCSQVFAESITSVKRLCFADSCNVAKGECHHEKAPCLASIGNIGVAGLGDWSGAAKDERGGAVPPTLTPRPTLSFVSKVTPTPVSTRPPLELTPTPEDKAPDDLQALYYVADVDAIPELHVIEIDQQGRRWSDSRAVIDVDEPLKGMHLSPDGQYLAAEGCGMGAMLYVVERASGKTWCPLGEQVKCSGSFVGWMHNNQLLFQPATDIANPLDVILGGILVVDLNTGRYHQLNLPTSSNGEYSSARNISLSPDNSRVAYSVTYTEDHTEFSEIWIMQLDNEYKQLIYKAKGVIHALSWSPVDEQLLFSYQPGVRPASSDPSELWLLNSDGTDKKFIADNYGRTYPVWSPNGSHIALVRVDEPVLFFSDWRGPGTNIYIVDAITGEITKLSTFEGRSNNYPTWSPDGKFIAFVSTILLGEPEMYTPGLVYIEVWVASVDGRQVYTLSGNAHWTTRLSWLPDTFSMQGR